MDKEIRYIDPKSFEHKILINSLKCRKKLNRLYMKNQTAKMKESMEERLAEMWEEILEKEDFVEEKQYFLEWKKIIKKRRKYLSSIIKDCWKE